MKRMHGNRSSLTGLATLAAVTMAFGTLTLGVVTSRAVAADAKPAKSLYDRLGGVGPISVVVEEFIDRLVVDDVLNANPAIKAARDRVPPSYLKFHVTSLVCQATGGPCKYAGRGMKESHVHLRITEREWDEMAKVFKAVLDKYKVPAKEQQELFAIVGTTKADIVQASQASRKN
jgi:hemoglobin